MTTINLKRPIHEAFEIIINLNKIMRKIKDSLFNANARNKMIAKYGYSEAMTITVEELIEDSKIQIVLLDESEGRFED